MAPSIASSAAALSTGGTQHFGRRRQVAKEFDAAGRGTARRPLIRIGVIMSLRPPDANISEIEPHNSSDAGDTVVVAVIPKNKSDNLVVSLCRYKGHKLVDVRV